MKVLLTGASGFIGKYVLESLRRHGIHCVVVGRRRIKADHVVKFIEADLLASPDFTALFKHADASHLLHLAWYTEHGNYWDSPINLRWVESTTRLVEAFCAGGGRRVVAAGTCAEYDWSYGFCREDYTPLHAATLYGSTKDAARRLVSAVCDRYRVPWAWGRVFMLYGEGEDDRRLVPSLIKVFRGKQAPFAVNGAAYRDFLHVSDVAEGFVTLLRHETCGNYNICSGQPMQLAALVRAVARNLDADPQSVLQLLPAGKVAEPALLIGDKAKLVSLGWSPSLSVSEGIRTTLHGRGSLFFSGSNRKRDNKK